MTLEKQGVDSIDLEILQEMLIIAFAYRAEERRFTIISSYPERSPGSSRDLIALVFNDVNRFHRELGNLPELRKYKFSYATKDEVGSREFQDIETGEGEDGCQHVDFWFGPNFGGIAFEYRSLKVYRRASRVIKVGDDIIYFDLVSNREFDVYNPFPDLL